MLEIPTGEEDAFVLNGGSLLVDIETRDPLQKEELEVESCKSKMKYCFKKIDFVNTAMNMRWEISKTFI